MTGWRAAKKTGILTEEARHVRTVRTLNAATTRRSRQARAGKADAVKGDRVEIVVDTGDATQTYEVVATKAGRRVETAVRRGVVEVTELTRSGTVVRTARFMASRVIAMVDHPVPRDEEGDGGR